MQIDHLFTCSRPDHNKKGSLSLLDTSLYESFYTRVDFLAHILECVCVVCACEEREGAAAAEAFLWLLGESGQRCCFFCVLREQRTSEFNKQTHILHDASSARESKPEPRPRYTKSFSGSLALLT